MVYILKLCLSFELKLEMQDQQGGIYQIEVDRTRIERTEPLRQQTTGKWIDKDKVAYISVPGFLSSEYEEKAIELVEQFRQSACIILDLRGNGGGHLPDQLAKKLHTEAFRYHSVSTVFNPDIFDHPMEDSQLFWRNPITQPSNESFKNGLIVLCDKTTCSSAESLIMTFVDYKRAIIIGDYTYSSTGGMYQYEFPNGARLSVGRFRMYFADGSEFEGRGIKPDIIVHRTREDVYSGCDKVLDKATEFAKNM